jgi:hypothetical protein
MNLNFAELMQRLAAVGAVLSLIVASSACKRASVRKGEFSSPLIAISPLEQGRGQWKVADVTDVTVTVTAPGAERVRILSRPEVVEGDYLEHQSLALPVVRAQGGFVTPLKLAPDFAGEMWAEAYYPDGSIRQTETIALTVALAADRIAPPLTAVGGSVGTDESARSDKLTGGGIRKTRLNADEPDVRITINAPAFLLTLWQNGKEVSSYHIGIGREDFPVPIGEREATAIILNPYWIPPDSVWVRPTRGVTPYQKINPGSDPSDPRIPLGLIKIPIGAGYLIYEAAKADDIGRAVSRGSIRMLGDDLFDLVEKIMRARNLPPAKAQLERARNSRERLAAQLDPPLLVDVNYDLQVVEDGLLRLYPDVYARGSFALDSLRAELQSVGVAAPLLDDRTLQRILNNVSVDKQFIISVAEIRKGRWNAGRTLPLTEKPIENGREIALARSRARRSNR